MDLEAAAQKLGVHYQTAYRWVRSGVLRAVKVGTEYDIDPGDVERLIEQHRSGRSAAARSEPDWGARRAELYGGLRTGDEVGAQVVVDGLAAGGVAPLELCEALIAPALVRLGEEYEAGTASSAEVVLAAEICDRLVGSLAAPPRGRPRGLVVVASPEGEHHRLPGLMATAALRAERWRVHHLGTDVPAADLAAFVQATTPDVVVLSVAAAVEAGTAARDRLVAGGGRRVLLGEAGAPLSRLLQDLV